MQQRSNLRRLYPTKFVLVPKVFFLYNTSMICALISTLARKEVAKMQDPIDEGQGLVEYALIVVMVAIVVMALLYLFGGNVGNIFSNIVSSV